MSILNIIVTQVLGSPVIVLGIIGLIGLITLKKSGSEILLGTTKVMMGYTILMGGATLIVVALDPLTKMIRAGLGVQGVIPLYWPAFAATMAKFGTQVALIFIAGFIINIILCRLTKLHFLALTVHLQLFWAGFIVVALNAVHISGWEMYLIGAIICGLYYWLVTAISFHYMKGEMRQPFANFVPSIMGVIVAAICGKIVGKGKSAEDIALPESLDWIKDTIVSITVVFFVFNILFALVAGLPYVNSISGGTYWLVFLFSSSLSFGASVAIILYGVRMLLAEIIPALNGIAERLLPNAIMGLDYPTIYPLAGTAVMFGFFFHLLGSIVATGIMAATHFSPIVVPGVQINFFEGALVGVYANFMGGLKNVILSCFIVGFLLQYGVAFVFPHTGMLMPVGYAYEAFDFNTIGLVIVKVLSLFH
ncbi:MAG: PTS transporter subunit IIC [Thermacetogeniaceae bacterium]|jgi:PTS system ascorbate-specific IIC component